MSTPGEKTFYVFTTEVEHVDEDKLKIAGDSFNVNTLVANKGDKVTVKFYNVDDVQTERHSFTIGDPYKVDIDLGFGENGNATFTAEDTGVFTYYCKYHLPVMTGQLVGTTITSNFFPSYTFYILVLTHELISHTSIF